LAVDLTLNQRLYANVFNVGLTFVCYLGLWLIWKNPGSAPRTQLHAQRGDICRPRTDPV